VVSKIFKDFNWCHKNVVLAKDPPQKVENKPEFFISRHFEKKPNLFLY